MLIIDPLGDMVRTMLNVAINCVIPILAGGREAMPTTQSSPLLRLQKEIISE